MRVFIKQAGFTLVELMTAIVIGAFFVGAASTLLVNSSRIAQRSRDVAVANSFAEDKVEEQRSIGYLGLIVGTTNITTQLPAELAKPRNATLTISQHTTAVKKVLLTMEYNDQGKQKTYKYTTYVGELGVGQY